MFDPGGVIDGSSESGDASRGDDSRRDGSERPAWYRRRVEVSVVLLAFLVLVTVLLGLLLWSALRHQDFSVEVSSRQGKSFLDQLPSLIAHSGGHLVEGNAIEIGQDAEFFERLMDDAAAARESIHLETYVWWEGEVCDRLAALLAERASEGLEVRVLVDAAGGAKMTEEVRETLRDGGVDLQWFHPFRLGNLGRYNFRDHRKIAVFDGRVAYVFGHGFDQRWVEAVDGAEQVRDTYLRLRGPIVHQIQAVFFENWLAVTRELILGERYFPDLAEEGTTPAHVAWIQPIGDVSAIEALFYGVLATAEREIVVQNPYFLVDSDGVELFGAAVRRGVRVRIMVPSLAATDHAIVQHASHHLYERLLESGVELWEYERSLLHQKVVVVDGEWASVGSTNFDDRSFELNDEIQIGMLDRALAAELLAAFERDLEHARRVELDSWRQRSWWHRLKDRSAHLFNEQL